MCVSVYVCVCVWVCLRVCVCVWVSICVCECMCTIEFVVSTFNGFRFTYDPVQHGLDNWIKARYLYLKVFPPNHPNIHLLHFFNNKKWWLASIINDWERKTSGHKLLQDDIALSICLFCRVLDVLREGVLWKGGEIWAWPLPPKNPNNPLPLFFFSKVLIPFKNR